MNRNQPVCHDFKTERPDVGQPLPAVARVLPIAFYFATVASIVLTAFFYYRLRAASTSKAEWLETEKQQTKLIADLEKVTSSVKAEVKKAEEVVSWVEGTREVQKLCLTVTRSMAPESTIAELAIDRQKDNPAQIQIGLKLNGGGVRGLQTQQIDETLKALEAVNYRSYSAQQNQAKGGALHYSATLIHQNPAG